MRHEDVQYNRGFSNQPPISLKQMKKKKDDQKLEKFQQELTQRVFERMNELSGEESQRDQLQATIQSLHETTGIPIYEVQKIAAEIEKAVLKPDTTDRSLVKTEFPLAPVSKSTLPDLGISQLTISNLNRRYELGKKGFTIHLVAYITANLTLLLTNYLTTPFLGFWFPWFIFPVSGWGIGLIAHYISAFFWNKSSLNKKTRVIKSEIHYILNENWDQYRANSDESLLNSVYRLVVMEPDEEPLRLYLQTADSSLKMTSIETICTQIGKLRSRSPF